MAAHRTTALIGRLGAVAAVVALGACTPDPSKLAVENAPPGFHVNCADWHKNERGNWVSNAKGTMFYPKKQGMLANTELVKDTPPDTAVNLWMFVEGSCGLPATAK